MYRDAVIYFGISPTEFYDMTIAEYKLFSERFKYNKQQRQLSSLDTAFYTSLLVMNKEAQKVYTDIHNSIIDKKPQVEESGDVLMNCINRALQLGLKVPSLD